MPGFWYPESQLSLIFSRKFCIALYIDIDVIAICSCCLIYNYGKLESLGIFGTKPENLGTKPRL